MKIKLDENFGVLGKSLLTAHRLDIYPLDRGGDVATDMTVFGER